jgi:hypothetical protein
MALPEKGRSFSFVIQPIYNALQDVERQEPSHAAAIERQQT